MTEEIEKLALELPGPIARPFLLAQKLGDQRKDLQRFCLENLVSFLAAVAVSDLLDYFQELRDSEKPDAKEIETIKDLQNSERLTGIDLEQMALGKWVELLRETTTESKAFLKTLKIPELIEFYNTPKEKKTPAAELVDKLVTKRNNDAHGSPIAADKLLKELDERGGMLEKVIEACKFLEDYRLVVIESFEIESGKTFYSGRAFVGNGTKSIRYESDSPIPQNEPILYHEKKKTITRLSPLVVYKPLTGPSEPQISIFSKVLDRNGRKMRYIALDGHSDIDLHREDEQHETELVRRRKLLLEIYSSPEVFLPGVQGELKLSQTVVDVGDANEFSLTLENPKKSIELFDLLVSLDYPSQISSVECLDKQNAEVTPLHSERSGAQKIEIKSLPPGSNQKLRFQFKTKEQGTFDIPPAILTYKYYRTESEREDGESDEDLTDVKFETDEKKLEAQLKKLGLTAGETEIDKVTLESQDPKSQDAMTPVLNISRNFSPSNGTKDPPYQIGDPFRFEITIENIGLGAARNASLELVFPPEVELVDGVVQLSFNLNPTEKRTFLYTLKTRSAGVYQVKVRNITYADSRGVRYATRCDDDYRVLVRGDVEKAFAFKVEDILQDLFISEGEEHTLEGIRRDLANRNYDKKTIEELEQKARADSVLRILRKLIREVCERRGQAVHQRVFEETGFQKSEGNQRRKSVVFSIGGFPFLAIDTTEPSSMKIHSLDEIGEPDEACAEGVPALYVSPFKGDPTLGRCVPIDNLLKSDDSGRGYMKKWTNRSLGFVEQHLLPWKKLTDALGDELGEEFTFRKGMFQTRSVSKITRRELGISENDDFFGVIRDPRSRKSPAFLVFLNLDKTATKRKEFWKQEREAFSALTFLSFRAAKDGSDEQKLLDTWYESNEKTNRPAVRIAMRSEADLEKALETIKRLIDLVRRSQTIGLLESKYFEKQRGIGVLCDRVDQLYQAGIGLRRSEKDPDSCIELYPYRAFPLGGSTIRNCVGFINKNSRNWDLWLKFYGDIDTNAPIFNHLKVHPQWRTELTGSSRWLYVNKAGEDESVLEHFVSAASEIGKGHTKDQLALWPKPIMREMLTEYGGKNSAFSGILKPLVSEGPTKWSLIKSELTKKGLDKQGEKLLREMRTYPAKYGWEVPIAESESAGDRTLQLSERFRETLEQMLEEDPNLDLSKVGDMGENNTHLAQIKKASPLLENKTATTGQVKYKGAKLRIGDCDTTLAIAINKKYVKCYLQVEGCEEVEETVRKVLGKLKNSLDSLQGRAVVSDVRTSGHKKEHLRLDVDIDHLGFERLGSEEKREEITQIAQEFCEAAEKAGAPSDPGEAANP